MEKITFNQRFLARNEANYVGQYITPSETGEIEKFEKKSLSMIANKLKSSFVHLTSSCTAALEVSSILSEIEAGDEVIMPSLRSVQQLMPLPSEGVCLFLYISRLTT